MKIFTFGDGYAHGHIWPEWPQILKALLPDHDVINTSGIGAGAEFLVTNFVDLIPQIQNSVVIFQWPIPKRFDKIIQDNSWDCIVDNDSTYSFNRVFDLQNRQWWLSSASKSSDIENYHDFYVQPQQHNTRVDVYQTLVYHTCVSLQCRYISTSTSHQETYSRKSSFINVRQHEIQPSPWVHFCWCKDIILPQLGLDLDITRQQMLEKKLMNHVWLPYDPDREEIWTNMVDSLDG